MIYYSLLQITYKLFIKKEKKIALVFLVKVKEQQFAIY